ncbi:uncharacterized protein KGF55_004797 [Candida pseudojiufengensis]|uniref:uncharacterized protein n=1 Tax=Candida pseudojiufengensis TaxID=497109 RepID=UPI002223F3B2|nr:uncharacterized protein KGF55_004797 [Candida pseudojiufengensis]KAI5960074.1 hypothetical protein KGF55_004797 [Candida pseudojiufengensis]
MSNTFNGEIKEIPGIYVDRFHTKGDLYFLTHSHQDHLQGLLSKSFCNKVYCSQLTKDIIALDSRYEEKLKYLIPVEYNKSFQLSTFLSVVTVTMIETYHAPGSSMFLFESDDDISVLVTGDIRAEEWWTSSLIKNRILFPYITGSKKLDIIYLDTTFSYRGEPYIKIMPNSDGVVALIELLKLYPTDPDIEFSFVDAVSGSEEIWLQVADHFNGTISANELVTERIKLIKNYHLEGDGPVFNVGNLKKDIPIMIAIKHTINFNIIDYAGFCLPVKVDTIDARQLVLLQILRNGHQLYLYQDRQWILPKDGLELLPLCLMLMFSRHSSYEESMRFIGLFKPKSVFPCCDSKKSWLNGFTIERVFGSVCSSKDHRYDKEKTELYGLPDHSILERKVVSIDRWSFSQCLQEVDFVEQYTKKERPFKGVLKLIDDNGDKSAYYSYIKDFKLQSIIAGRNEAKYKKVVNYHQDIKQMKINEIDHGSDLESDSSTPSLNFESSTPTDPSTEIDIVYSSVYTEQSISEMNNSNLYLSPFINHKEIDEIAQKLREDRRNWHGMKLKCINSANKKIKK